MTKKILAAIVGAAMLAAMPVYAANENSMSVEYLRGNSYMWSSSYMLSIPEKITLSSTETKTVNNIGVSAVNTTSTEKVQVKISSGIANNQVELTREKDTSTKVVSDVTDGRGNPVSIGSVVAEFEGTSIIPITADTGVLNFSKVRDSANGIVKAGSYSGTIVFEAAVVKR